MIPTNPGGLQSRVDPRDYKWSEVGAASTPFDWTKGYDIEGVLSSKLGRPFKLPVKNQGQSSSCGGQAWSYLGEVLEALATTSFEERSAKFIYSQTYVVGGGSTGRDNAALVKKQGWGLESLTPSYQNGAAPAEIFMERNTDITDEARNNAKKALSAAYVNVDMGFNSIAQAVRDNNGAIILIQGQDNGTWTSTFPHPPTSAVWRHWIYVGKALTIDGKKYLGFINSWGNVGTGGWQYLGLDYMPYIIEGWTHTYNANPAVTPHHYFTVEMDFGQLNDEIKALQQVLQYDGTFPAGVPCSGFYGEITRKAVLDFQIKYQVDSLAALYQLNGKVVGPKTRAKLNSLFGN